VKELYVQAGDEVKEGDPLVLLSTGELFSASFDGVVNEIRVEVGDWIWPNFTVVQINDLQHLEVSMNVDEYDIEQLTLGEACTVSVISLGVDFETEIAHINRVSQSQGSVAFYSVTCDLTVPVKTCCPACRRPSPSRGRRYGRDDAGYGRPGLRRR
jgi:multidrug resistance efflux pump